MSKNLILFSDGTGNSAAKLFKTNVWRVYQALDLKDHQIPEKPRQFAYYDDGVGTSWFKPLALLGGVFGVGLSRNVRDLYVFLCRMYEPGDQIYVFGFSRGAFTVRVLVGLVLTQGLVRYKGSESELQRLAHEAYRAYRAEKFKGPVLTSVGRALRNAWVRLKNKWSGNRPYSKVKKSNVPCPSIAYMGLWDTVDAYGLPIEQLTDAIDKYLVPLNMRDYLPYPQVLRARHALALDDERRAFTPRLWSEGHAQAGIVQCTPQYVRDQRISQVWFAGMHSNVGGGYPEDSLSHVSLKWIMNGARPSHLQAGNPHPMGLRFEDSIWEQLDALSDENGTLYDSRRGMGSYYAYLPRRIDRLNCTDNVKVPITKVHESVLRRIQVDPDGYAPIGIPGNFCVVLIDGEIKSAEQYLASQGHSLTQARAWLKRYDVAREHVFNLVWLRRINYFLTLFFTVALLALPLFASGTDACTSRFCFISWPILWLDYVLPVFTEPWTRAFAVLPLHFLLLVACLWWSISAGKRLENRIRDRMRRVWYGIPALKPATVASMPEHETISRTEQAIQAFRLHPVYQQVFYFASHKLLPTIFILLVFAGFLTLCSRAVFTTMASTGFLCSAPAPFGTKQGTPVPFDPRSPCQSAHFDAKKGQTYRVTFTLDKASRWKDLDIPAGPQGFECELGFAKGALMAASVPLRRHFSEPWFMPIARVGNMGNDVYALHMTRAGKILSSRCSNGKPLRESTQVYSGEFTARSSGHIFVYVNDAVLWVPGFWPLYGNNAGAATVAVKQLPPPVEEIQP